MPRQTACGLRPPISIHALREESDEGQSTRRTKWHISIHALREESDEYSTRPQEPQSISIHALREESDQFVPFTAVSVKDFYPRPPRGERQSPTLLPRGFGLFLSTPSARRATRAHFVRLFSARYFYPRPPRGERPQARAVGRIERGYFYPRPPRGERRSYAGFLVPGQIISIHALREESDIYLLLLLIAYDYFLLGTL